MSLLDGLKKVEKQLRSLERTEVFVKADGSYPVRAKTKVQHVAKYQNDGTEKIKPSHFVQRAEKKYRYWHRPLDIAVGRWIFRNESRPMDRLAKEIAHGITLHVDRIDTGRLRASIRGRVNRR